MTYGTNVPEQLGQQSKLPPEPWPPLEGADDFFSDAPLTGPSCGLGGETCESCT